jgi:hypothetical protein
LTFFSNKKWRKQRHEEINRTIEYSLINRREIIIETKEDSTAGGFARGIKLRYITILSN